MTLKDYLGDWNKVIDKDILTGTMRTLLNTCPGKYICPKFTDIFKAFRYCPYDKLKIVMLGQDPYPQKGVATGLLFANNIDTPEDKLSPSLKIIKNTVEHLDNKDKNPIFDQTMINWAEQGILLINAALTVEMNKIGSHTMLWRPFISNLLNNISVDKPDTIFLLLGETAKTFSNAINLKYPNVQQYEHPAWYARNPQYIMSDWMFVTTNDILEKSGKETIKW